MDIKEYIDSLTEQIQNKRAKKLVAEELKNHIIDQAESYVEEGMDEQEAVKLAVKQMGSPVETGQKMNRIHRAQFPWKMMVMILLLTIAGILMQAVTFPQVVGNEALNDTYLEKTIGYNLFGLGIILVIIFMDYTVLARYAYSIYAGYVILKIGALLWFNVEVPGSVIPEYAVQILYPIVLCGLIYRNRNTGMRGIVCCLGMSALSLGVDVISGGSSLTAIVETAIIISIVIVAALAKGIFGKDRKKYMLHVCGLYAVIMGIGAAAIYLCYGNYVIQRLQDVFFAGEARGSSYQIVQLRESVQHFTLFGTGTFYLEHATAEMYSTFVLHTIFSYFGIIAGVLVMAGMLAFGIGALVISLKQNSRIAFLAGITSSVCLLLLICQYIAINFGYGLCYTSFIPFLRYGFLNTVVCSIYVGLVLSVYRNSRILGEGKAAQQKKLKIKLLIESE